MVMQTRRTKNVYLLLQSITLLLLFFSGCTKQPSVAAGEGTTLENKQAEAFTCQGSPIEYLELDLVNSTAAITVDGESVTGTFGVPVTIINDKVALQVSGESFIFDMRVEQLVRRPQARATYENPYCEPVDIVQEQERLARSAASAKNQAAEEHRKWIDGHPET